MATNTNTSISQIEIKARRKPIKWLFEALINMIFGPGSLIISIFLYYQLISLIIRKPDLLKPEDLNFASVFPYVFFAMLIFLPVFGIYCTKLLIWNLKYLLAPSKCSLILTPTHFIIKEWGKKKEIPWKTIKGFRVSWHSISRYGGVGSVHIYQPDYKAGFLFSKSSVKKWQIDDPKYANQFALYSRFEIVTKIRPLSEEITIGDYYTKSFKEILKIIQEYLIALDIQK